MRLVGVATACAGDEKAGRVRALFPIGDMAPPAIGQLWKALQVRRRGSSVNSGSATSR